MPQLDSATFQLQAIGLILAFSVVYFLIYWMILPNIQISIFLREHFMLEIEEYLDLNYFNYNKYITFSTCILSNFLQFHIFISENYFLIFSKKSFSFEILELNFLFIEEVFSYLISKSKILYGISKLN